MRIWTHALMAGLLAAPLLAASVRAEDSGQGEKMKQNLGLSDEQFAKIKDARKAREDAVKPLREQLKADLEKLRGQVKANAADADIQATLDHMKQARTGIEDAVRKFRDSMESTLKPTQRAKMLLGMVQRMRARGGKSGGKGERGSAPKPGYDGSSGGSTGE